MNIINNILLIFILLISILFFSNTEPFLHTCFVDFYVITMNNPDRVKNIAKQLETQINIMDTNDATNGNKNSFKFSIEKIDAVVGKNLDLNELIQQKKIHPDIANEQLKLNAFDGKVDNRKREVGCYLSHLKTYELIKLKNKGEYSIILEDDFQLTKEFMYALEDTLTRVKNNNVNFDFLFLGITGNNGDNILDNVYKVKTPSMGTHGYLINNKSIDKIIEKLSFIDEIVDYQIFKKGEQNELIVLRVNPVIINYGGFVSEIRL